MIDSLPVLILDVFSRCNCRCVMCDIWKRTATHQFDPDDLNPQLPAIERLRVEWVVLTGGEPLMHPGLFRLCAPLKERGLRLTLLTTGLLLERFGREIAQYIDDVIVSLDGPPEIHNRIRRVPDAFERMSAGIRALRKIRNDFPVSARSTVQRLNCAHLCRTVEAARALHCDSISFLTADTHSSAFDHSGTAATRDISLAASDLDTLAAELERLIASGECGGFIAERPEKLRRLLDQARWALGIGDPVAPPCNAPWVSAVVGADGAVRPCFFHAPVGSIASGVPLDELLNAPAAHAFRSGLNVATNPICRRCVCSLNWKGRGFTDPSHLHDDFFARQP
jgi:MoaA/NifB/PqqE/SkfB family radical SAM enzyme